jgi:hypothetical protein
VPSIFLNITTPSHKCNKSLFPFSAILSACTIYTLFTLLGFSELVELVREGVDLMDDVELDKGEVEEDSDEQEEDKEKEKEDEDKDKDKDECEEDKFGEEEEEAKEVTGVGEVEGS